MNKEKFYKPRPITRKIKIVGFLDMGFEEIKAVGDKVTIYLKKDFLEGGKMEQYANYTVEEFEDENSVVLSFRYGG